MALIDWDFHWSIPFNFKLKGTHPRIETFAKGVAERINLGTRKREQKLEFLKCLLINLKISWESKHYLSISMDRNYYSKNAARYRRNIQSYRTVSHIINEMVRIGFLEIKKGFKNPETKKGFQTKIRPSDRFGGFIHSVEFNMFEVIRPQEVIILRDENDNEIDYRDTAPIIEMRNHLNFYNDIREKTKFTIVNAPYDLIEFADDRQRLQYFSKVSLDRIRNTELINVEMKTSFLVRIFNGGSFKLGGRFYRGFESLIPKEAREYIFINNQETIECDFSGMHLRMAYHVKRLEVEGDPYIVKENQPPQLRDFYKIISLIMLNVSDEKSAFQGIRNKYRGSDYKKFIPNLTDAAIKPHCDAIIEAHKPIRDLFYSGIGSELQNIDSRIANGILNHFAKQGIMALCIHDSFIVDKRHSKELIEVMIAEYKSVFPDSTPIVK